MSENLRAVPKCTSVSAIFSRILFTPLPAAQVIVVDLSRFSRAASVVRRARVGPAAKHCIARFSTAASYLQTHS